MNKAGVVSGVNTFEEITTSYYGWAGFEEPGPGEDDSGSVTHYHAGKNRPFKWWAKLDEQRLRRRVKHEVAHGLPSKASKP